MGTLEYLQNATGQVEGMRADLCQSLDVLALRDVYRQRFTAWEKALQALQDWRTTNGGTIGTRQFDVILYREVTTAEKAMRAAWRDCADVDTDWAVEQLAHEAQTEERMDKL